MVTTIGFIGAGNMASSLIQGLLDSGFDKNAIQISDTNVDLLKEKQQQFGIKINNTQQLASDCNVIVLAVKPQIINKVSQEIASVVQKNTLVISIAAGITLKSIEQYLSNIPIIRVMPNTPALIQTGASGLFANSQTTNEQKNIAEQIFNAVGITTWVAKENLLDVITALSGSGPAYFLLMMESMTQGAIDLGLDKEVANLFAIQTALGASKMALESEFDCATLREKVTSPNGTTFAALESFKNDNFSNIIKNAMDKASQRAAELGKHFE
jgi:pyrroline-5-carboxylate reductase